MTLNTTCQEENFSLQVVKTSILNEETRRIDKCVLSQSKANTTQNSDTGRSKQRSPQRRDNSQARSMSRGKLTCFYCGNHGHFQKECRHLKKDKGASNNVEPRKIFEKKGTSAMATNEEELMFICEEASVNLANEECTWVIDSGASFHTTPWRKCFSSYTVGDYGCVKMGDIGACKIAGIGSVCLTMSTGCRLTLRDVRHVPDIRLNMVSIGRLNDEGCSGSFQNGMWKLCKGSLIEARAQKQGTLYVMHAKMYKKEANVAAELNGDLWHKRLGHMSERGMHILANQKLLSEVKRVHLEKCVDCTVGKQNRVAFH